MALSDRIRAVIDERGITQLKFAASLGVGANYVNCLVNGRNEKISKQLAKLIEALYGYSESWILTGTGSKFAGESSGYRSEIYNRVLHMSDNDAKATLAFIHALETLNAANAADE